MLDLAVYAANPNNSRGRCHQELSDPERNEYQRDRDRIIHCSAFRRLEYKTQVFVNHEGDLFRTRLTHSIEVAQIARSVVRALTLNEDLVEAICLAHDLGHTPFGHSGQDALNACMKDAGGFEHNLQSLRVVDLLEDRYGSFKGLNLCFETREGILKHCSIKNARRLGALGQRFIDGSRPSLEAQIANLADEIAYNNHDVDDGLRSGLISIDQLQSVSIFRKFFLEAQKIYPSQEGRTLVYETIRRIINFLVNDLIYQTRSNIRQLRPRHIDDVRAAKTLASFSEETKEAHRELKLFLGKYLYRHKNVVEMAEKSKSIVRQLFNTFFDNPVLLPKKFLNTAETCQMRGISDYIAGMTDRYAIQEHNRLCSPMQSQKSK